MDSKKLISILLSVLGAVENGKPLTNVANDLSDIEALTGVLNAAGVNLDSNILATIQKSAAGEHNLESGQAALVGTVGASFNGVADKVVILAVRQSSDLAKQLLGL